LFFHSRFHYFFPSFLFYLHPSFLPLLNAFVKLRKEIICIVKSVLSVRLSVRPQGTTRLPINRFSLHFILKAFTKICRKNSIFVKIGQKY
jgi:hypothetical protein